MEDKRLAQKALQGWEADGLVAGSGELALVDMGLVAALLVSGGGADEEEHQE